jgi:hypothetical protein
MPVVESGVVDLRTAPPRFPSANGASCAGWIAETSEAQGRGWRGSACKPFVTTNQRSDAHFAAKSLQKLHERLKNVHRLSSRLFQNSPTTQLSGSCRLSFLSFPGSLACSCHSPSALTSSELSARFYTAVEVTAGCAIERLHNILYGRAHDQLKLSLTCFFPRSKSNYLPQFQAPFITAGRLDTSLLKRQSPIKSPQPWHLCRRKTSWHFS